MYQLLTSRIEGCSTTLWKRFADIAMRLDRPRLALQVGFREQAHLCLFFNMFKKLLEKRKLYREQIPIFQTLLDYQSVISRAVQVGDNDLGKSFRMFHVLSRFDFPSILVVKAVLDAKDVMRLGDYFSMIRSHPIAQMSFVKHMTWTDPQLLREFYWQNDLFEDLASFSLMESKNTMVSCQNFESGS